MSHIYCALVFVRDNSILLVWKDIDISVDAHYHQGGCLMSTTDMLIA